MKRFRLWLGASLIGLSVFTGLAGPLAVSEDPFSQDLDNALTPPNCEHPLGTDHLGRSVLSRLVYGARQSMIISVVCVGMSVLIGATAGLAAGFSAGWVDIIIMRLVDGLMAFPGTLLAIVLVGTIGDGASPLVAALVLMRADGVQVDYLPMALTTGVYRYTEFFSAATPTPTVTFTPTNTPTGATATQTPVTPRPTFTLQPSVTSGPSVTPSPTRTPGAPSATPTQRPPRPSLTPAITRRPPKRIRINLPLVLR